MGLPKSGTEGIRTEQPGRGIRMKRYQLSIVGLVLLFSWPLIELIRFAWNSELHSYILLIPVVSWYLGSRKVLPLGAGHTRSNAISACLILLGVGLEVAYLFNPSRSSLVTEDRLFWQMSSFVLIFQGLGFFFLGINGMRSKAFAMMFMLFIIPFPHVVTEGIETFLQIGSAWLADLMFQAVGTPVYKEGVYFTLPGFKLQVAPECSGIHSTLVLFLTSLMAGYLFLRSPMNRLLLVLFVVPLALIRNAFRILVIGELCVHVGPQMIDSPIHHQGGPIFFVLSLVPFILLMGWMWRREREMSPSQKS